MDGAAHCRPRFAHASISVVCSDTQFFKQKVIPDTSGILNAVGISRILRVHLINCNKVLVG